MKQTIQRFLAVLLAMTLLVMSFAACSGGTGSSSASETDQSSSNQESAPAESGDESEPGETGETTTDTGLPLTEEPVTLRFWFQITAG